MKNFLFLLLLITFSNSLHAKLLDKVIAVYDDQVITQSSVTRIQNNVVARKNISPLIYDKTKLSPKDVVDLIVHRNLIRSNLTEMGYIISDDQVESEIKATEERLNLSRQQLLNFLESNGLTFNEYFEITRETIEFNFFSARIIRPLVSITEQEIKNTFYKNNASNKTLSFKYNLVDFSISKSKLSKSKTKAYRDSLKNFQESGNIPSEFKDLETNVLGDITEDGLTSELKELLKKTDEGSFSEALLMDNSYHVFYVKKKDLVESEIFQRSKNQISATLFEERSKSMTSVWFQRESGKHYIKMFL